MAVTEPGNLADLNHDGSTETTAITNAMAGQKGYPMHLVDGGVIKVVKKAQGVGGITAFFDADGNEYVPAAGHYGKLVKVEKEDVDETPAEPTDAAQEAAFGPEGPPAEPAEQDAGTEEPATEQEEKPVEGYSVPE